MFAALASEFLGDDGHVAMACRIANKLVQFEEILYTSPIFMSRRVMHQLSGALMEFGEAVQNLREYARRLITRSLYSFGENKVVRPRIPTHPLLRHPALQLSVHAKHAKRRIFPAPGPSSFPSTH